MKAEFIFPKSGMAIQNKQASKQTKYIKATECKYAKYICLRVGSLKADPEMGDSSFLKECMER